MKRVYWGSGLGGEGTRQGKDKEGDRGRGGEDGDQNMRKDMEMVFPQLKGE